MNSRALWASWAISGVLVLGLAACALEHNTDPLPSGEQLLWQSHDAKPPWVSAPPPRDADPVQFVGVSFRHQTERGNQPQHRS